MQTRRSLRLQISRPLAKSLAHVHHTSRTSASHANQPCLDMPHAARLLSRISRTLSRPCWRQVPQNSHAVRDSLAWPPKPYARLPAHARACSPRPALVFPARLHLAAILLVREPLEQDFANQGHPPWLRHAYAEAWLRSTRVGPHAGRIPHYEGLTNPPPPDEADVLVGRVSKYSLIRSSNCHNVTSRSQVASASLLPSHCTK